MDNKKKRIYGLDYMRGISCILVMLYHYTTRIVEIFPEINSKWIIKVPFGYMGVAVFFLLSGFLSLKQYKPEQNILEFVINKIKRLYPCYWLAAIITYFVVDIFLEEKAVSLKTLLLNLTMMESFLGAELVDGAYWTLANELIFYTFIAIVFVVLKHKHKFNIYAITWLVCANAILCIDSDNLCFTIFNKLFMAQYVQMFLAGGFIFVLFYYEKKVSRIIAVLGWGICLITQMRVFGANYMIFFLIANILLIIFVLMDKQNINYPMNLLKLFRPVAFFASISYPLYLIHQNIGYTIIINLYRFGVKNEVVIVIPIIILTGLAFFMHRFIEVPILSYQGGKNGKNTKWYNEIK
ncbi:acyltransferase [Mediterraneibacter sp. HCN-7094]